MGGRYLVELADVLRDAGLTVVEYDGWQTRARSSGGYDAGQPWCFMWHHTASQTTPANDASYMCHGSDSRPIANLLGARDGAVWVLAAGRTNTNGSGGPFAVSRGTVPADRMNDYAVSLELANSGVGEPYPVAQIDAAFAASVAVTTWLGLDPGDVANHADWTTRKIDCARADAVQGPWRPRSVNSSGTWARADLIDECRRRAAAGPTPEVPDLTDEQDQMLRAIFAAVGSTELVSNAVWHQTTPDAVTGAESAMWAQVVNANGAAHAAAAGVSELGGAAAARYTDTGPELE